MSSFPSPWHIDPARSQSIGVRPAFGPRLVPSLDLLTGHDAPMPVMKMLDTMQAMLQHSIRPKRWSFSGALNDDIKVGGWGWL